MALFSWKSSRDDNSLRWSSLKGATVEQFYEALPGNAAIAVRI